jgi:hypothetical protein
MTFKFTEDSHDRYYKALADAIKLEFNFTKQVAAGQVDGRQDVIDKYVKNLNRGLGVLSGLPGVGGFISIASDIVSLITSYVQHQRHSAKESRLQTFGESLTRCDSNRKYELYINNIAREITYRYGMNITFLLSYFNEDERQINMNRILDLLSHVAALRIMFYALKENISIENTNGLVNGLIDGYEGWEGNKLSHSLNKITLFQSITGGSGEKDSSLFTAEGFYANCGYVIPKRYSYSFYIDRNVSEKNNYIHYLFPLKEEEKGGKKSSYAGGVLRNLTGTNPPVSAGGGGSGATVTASSSTSASSELQENEKNNPRDKLIPKYGYAFSSELPKSEFFPDKLGQHFPLKAAASMKSTSLSVLTNNQFLIILKNNYFQFISNDQLELYLASSSNNKPCSVDFRKWLIHTYPELYHGRNGILPIYRGIINEDHLKRKGLSFTNGLFIGCDFSFCFFKNISFSLFSSCLCIKSKFENCFATKNVLNGSDFTLSTFYNCNFQGLTGMILMNYTTIDKTLFNNARITFQYEGAVLDPISVDSFADSPTTEVSSFFFCYLSGSNFVFPSLLSLFSLLSLLFSS